MAFFRTADGPVIHFEHRPGEAMPIVFANSLGTDFRVFDALLPLLPQGHELLRFDKRGHGLSDLVDAPLAIDGLAGDLAALMDSVGVKKALVVGLSIGGLIAQSLAASRPDLVRGLVLMDTAHKIGTNEMWQQRIDVVRKAGIASMADAILERWFTAEYRTMQATDLAGWRNMLVRTPAEGYARCCEAIRDADLTAQTRELDFATLCLVGREDGSTPVELVEELSGLIDKAEFEIIEHAGHIPCVEQPEVTAGRINRFIRERLA